MNEKRFKIVDEQFISYYGGTGHKISNEECGFWLWHNKIESQEVCDKLNSILDENEQLKYYKEAYADEIVTIKQTIKESYKTERTDLGSSVLKQLAESLEIQL